MSADPKSKQPIVVEGWTWGLDDLNSQRAAFRANDLAMVCEMADELLSKPITDAGDLISILVKNLVLPFEKANQLAKYGQKFWYPHYCLCTRTDAPPEELEKWAESGNRLCIGSIVKNPNTKLETIEKLSRHSDPEVAYEALHSGRLPQETIDSFASHVEPRIKQAVASVTQNPEIIRAMAKSADWGLSVVICLNPHTPTEVINEIGRSHLEAIVTKAYRVTDPAVLRSLCDKYGNKYEVYLTNKPMPADAESRKRWPLVVNGHCWGLDEPESLAAAAEVKDREQILRMADDILSKRLDIDRYPTLGTEILDHLIANEVLPIEIAKKLPALTTDWECRNRLVSRADVTPEVLDEFADHPGQYVVNSIVHNDKVKPETVAKIALNGEPHEVYEALKSRYLPYEILNKFVTSEYAEFRELVARGTNNQEVLAKLAFDTEAQIRAAAIINPQIETAVREKVALTDKNLNVAATATERLTNPAILEKVANRKDFSDNEALVLAVKNNKCASEGVRSSAATIHAANSKYY